MACYHPITIRNPKLVKDSLIDKTMLEVPCGHCIGCKDEKRVSWFIRLYYEWQYCVDNGGFALFETLTYNNAHLPKLVIADETFPCFNVRDIQLYLKRVRKKISLVYPHLNIKFKYFLAMEYGGLTHRPHYHVIFFVSSPLIRPFDFKAIVEELWHNNGFTMSGKYNNGFVNGSGGLSYCSKYVCKDIYEECYFRSIRQKLEKLGVTSEQMKPFFPHSMQSKNLGVYALFYDKLNDYFDFLNGNIKLPDKENGVRSYKLPLYYDRKLFFSIKYRFFNGSDYCVVSDYKDVPSGFDYCPIYCLNEEGSKMKDIRLIKSLDAVTHVYRICLAFPEDNILISKINDKFKQNFESLVSLQAYIKKSLPEETFIAYSLAYRGICCVFDYSCSLSVGSDLYRDLSVINDCKRGLRPLSLDIKNLCSNVDYYNSIDNIEDIYQIIRFLYYLIHLENEKIFNDKEKAYVEQKTIHLALYEPTLYY